MFRKYLELLKSSSFLRMNAIYFTGSMVMAVINYLFYPVLSRLLPVASFGELQVLIAVFSQVAIFFTVLTMVSVNIVVNEKRRDVANETIAEIEKAAIYVGAAAMTVVIIFSPHLQKIFKFASPWPFVILALTVMVSIPGAFAGAYLRGKKDFTSTSIQGIITAIVKLVGAASLVLLGFKTAGAVAGLLLAQTISLAYAFRKARHHGFVRPKSHPKPNWLVIRPQARYAAVVLAVSLMITLQASLDITVIKYLFSPETAGLYAGISIISNIVFYIAGTFTAVLLSSVEQAKLPRQNSSLLVKTLGIILVLAGSTALMFALYPELAVKLLVGEKYSAFASLLPLLSLSMLTMAVCNLFASYHIALRHYKVVWFVAIGAVSSYIFLLLNHGSPRAVVISMLTGNLIMLVSLAAWTGFRTLPLVRLDNHG